SRRVGYEGHWRRWLLNQIVRGRERPGPIEHQSKRFLRIAEDCGAETFNVQRSTFNAQRDGQPIKIGLCPGAEYGPAKRWFPERFAEVVVAVSAQRPVEWILFGTPDDAGIGATIEASVGNNCINRIGKTTMHDLIAELGECALLLTN